MVYVLIKMGVREGQSDGVFLRATCLLSELKALRASTSSTASFSCDLYISLTAWIAASVSPIWFPLSVLCRAELTLLSSEHQFWWLWKWLLRWYVWQSHKCKSVRHQDSGPGPLICMPNIPWASTYSEQSRLAMRARELQMLSEAFLNAVHIHLQPLASIPMRPAAPSVCSAAVRIKFASVLSNIAGCEHDWTRDWMIDARCTTWPSGCFHWRLSNTVSESGSHKFRVRRCS